MTTTKHIIDTDIELLSPRNLSVVSNRQDGLMEWDSKKWYLCTFGQQFFGGMSGHMVRKELAGRPVLNAYVLEYLLANPHLIPEEWKGKWVYFWGTVYMNDRGSLCVRCLNWSWGRWRWDSRWLDNGLAARSPAIIRV